MKVRKRLWGAVLLLCALLCMVTVIVSADDSGIHTHPICGATHTDIGDHTEECADVVWTAWNGTDDIDYGESNTAYVYLTGDATRSNGLTVTGGTLNLCLNGKTLNSGITVEGNGTLNICDCRGGGAITGDSAPVIYVKTVNESNVHTTLNLYGGKISGSSDTFSSGMIELYNNDYGNAQTAAVFNMYGGEVINGGSDGAAVYANYANVGSAYYSLNIYGGSVGSEKGDGFYFDNNKNITIQIAGGTITSGGYAVNLCSGNTLTLSGSPKFIDKVSSGNSAGIYLPKDTSFIVKDDFIGTASVMQALGETVKGVIAKPASGNSLSTKVQYFTSAEEGYFVECDADGHLRLTACAITEQPTADNRYTVAANGNHYYQWYRAKRDNVSLTSEMATEGDFSYSAGWGEWYYYEMKYAATPVTLKVFTLYMMAGDVLTLKKESESGNFFITDITFTHSDGSEVTTTEEAYRDYTYMAPKDGEYTLEITAGCMEMEGSDSYYLNLSFTATVSADVAGDILSGQTDKTLDTAALISGKYICAVTWEGKTTLYSKAVEFVHSHTWNDGQVTTDPTCTATGVKTFTCTVCSETKTETMNALGHSWVEATCTEPKTCSVCNATEGEALGHTWVEATCTTPKTCSVCNATEGEALGHSWKDATCTTPKTCSVCDATEGEALGHTWVEATCTTPKTCSVCNATEGEALGHTWVEATCTTPKTCSVCNATEGKALGHDFTDSTWQSDADRHWKKCSRCEVIAEESNHAGGTATCKGKAVCATCSKAYGVSNPDNHVGGTEIRDMVKATAEKTGHTGNCYCKGCNAKLSDGTVIPVTSDLSTDKKDGLTAALKDMEKFLNEQSDVYKDEQKQQLADSIEVIKSALKSIENAEEAVKKAKAMPAADKTRPDDKAAIDAYEAAKKAYDVLSADEKKMAGERTKSALNAMLKALTAYDVTYGNGSTWKKNESDNGLTFTVNGYHKKFAGITVNGEVVDESHYDIETGSTVITLKAEYLQTLPAGTYTLLVRYTDGSTDGEDTFTITQNVPSDPSDPSPAKTADNGVIFVWIGIVIFCLIVVIVLVWFFKKQKQ